MKQYLTHPKGMAFNKDGTLRNVLPDYVIRTGYVGIKIFDHEVRIFIPGYYIGRGLWVVPGIRDYASERFIFGDSWEVAHGESGTIVKMSFLDEDIHDFIKRVYYLKELDWTQSQEYILENREQYEVVL